MQRLSEGISRRLGHSLARHQKQGVVPHTPEPLMRSLPSSQVHLSRVYGPSFVPDLVHGSAAFAEQPINAGVSAETLMVIMRHKDFAKTRKFLGACRGAQSAAGRSRKR